MEVWGSMPCEEAWRFLICYLLSLYGLHVVQFLRYLYPLFQFSNQTWACHKYHSSKFLEGDHENPCPTLLYKKKKDK